MSTEAKTEGVVVNDGVDAKTDSVQESSSAPAPRPKKDYTSLFQGQMNRLAGQVDKEELSTVGRLRVGVEEIKNPDGREPLILSVGGQATTYTEKDAEGAGMLDPTVPPTLFSLTENDSHLVVTYGQTETVRHVRNIPLYKLCYTKNGFITAPDKLFSVRFGNTEDGPSVVLRVHYFVDTTRIALLDQLFSLLDQDGSGRVDLMEVRSWLEAANKPSSVKSSSSTEDEDNSEVDPEEEAKTTVVVLGQDDEKSGSEAKTEYLTKPSEQEHEKAHKVKYAWLLKTLERDGDDELTQADFWTRADLYKHLGHQSKKGLQMIVDAFQKSKLRDVNSRWYSEKLRGFAAAAVDPKARQVNGKLTLTLQALRVQSKDLKKKMGKGVKLRVRFIKDPKASSGANVAEGDAKDGSDQKSEGPKDKPVPDFETSDFAPIKNELATFECTAEITIPDNSYTHVVFDVIAQKGGLFSRGKTVHISSDRYKLPRFLYRTGSTLINTTKQSLELENGTTLYVKVSKFHQHDKHLVISRFFRALDMNGSGTLISSEVLRWFNMIKSTTADDDAKQQPSSSSGGGDGGDEKSAKQETTTAQKALAMVERLDTNKDGVISFDEFYHLFGHLTPSAQLNLVVAKFQEATAKGTIQADLDAARELLEAIDADGDCEISEEEEQRFFDRLKDEEFGAKLRLAQLGVTFEDDTGAVRLNREAFTQYVSVARAMLAENE